MERQVKGSMGSTRKSIWQTIGTIGLIVISCIVSGIAVWMIFLYAPMDSIEGNTQRIFYIHVPMAWVAFLAFGVLTFASICYLRTKEERWDNIARATAEIGTVFTTLTLITGMLWGKPIWGTWWTWDARLTSTLVLWFIYVGYLMLRGAMGRTTQSAKAGAIIGIIGFIDIPIIYESVNWWRTLHPQAVLPLGSAPQLPASMLFTLLVSLLAFTLLYSFLLLMRYHIEHTNAQLEIINFGASHE